MGNMWIIRVLRRFLTNPSSAAGIGYNLFTSLVASICRSRRVRCNICGWEGYRFLAIIGASYVRYNAICPICGSAERNRALLEYLACRNDFGNQKIRCLDIGPVKGFGACLEAKGWKYVSVDLDPGVAMVKMDAVQLGFVDNAFDFIICSHVLEHIKADLEAMKEMLRVLKRQGICYIMVPFARRAKTIEYEGPNPLDPGHVRSYGLDILDRIKSVGFKVKVVNLVSELNKYHLSRYGIEAKECCFVCTSGK